MKNSVGEISPTQLITTFGPGAIVDAKQDSIMVLDIEYWDNAFEIIYDKQLSNFLKKKYFKKIPVRGQGDIPSIPFPYYHICTKATCKRLFDIRESIDLNIYLKEGPICPDCGFKAYPARFVVSCEDNHIDDFPWRWWVHRKTDKENCKGSLRLFSHGKSSGLESIMVKCECGAWSSLAGAMTKGSFTGFKCTGHNPHKMQTEECGNDVIPLQRGASNVYFPAIRSVICVNDLNSKEIPLNILNEIKKFVLKKGEKQGLQDYYEYHDDELKKHGIYCLEELKERYRVSNEIAKNEINYTKIKEIEYSRLTNFEGGKISIPHKRVEFEAELQPVPDDLKKYFSKIVQIHRLKEIMVLLGFMRNDIPEPEVESPKKITWLGSYNDWLPAVEIYGEGIFLELNRETLDIWHEYNRQKSFKYNEIFRDWLEHKNWQLEERDAVYVLLHTLSHLLIKQLSLKSGYPASSIKERIYYSKDMAGILIYTGSNDQEGTLGGLVEMGRIENFRVLLMEALKESIFCTNDPICSSRNINEEDSLNGSACYACSMVSETACEFGNRMLDRSLVVPLPLSKSKAFFEGLIDE